MKKNLLLLFLLVLLPKVHAQDYFPNNETVQKAVSLSEQELDYVTRDLVQEILEKEEAYWDWTTTQLDLAEKVGIENYIQSQI